MTVDWLPSQSGAGEQGTADSRSDPHVGTSQLAVTVEQWFTVVHRDQSNFRRQPNLSGRKPPRSGPVNRSTWSEPTADLWDTFYLVVFPTFRGTSSFRKPSAKCFTRSARCPKGRRFSRCSAHGADWHKRCAGPMPAQWKRPRRVFRCCPAARHARRSTSPPLPGGWANLLVVLPTPTTLRVTGRQSAAG